MASRKEQKEALRQERLAAERAAAAEERRRRIARNVVGGVLAAGAAAGLIALILTNTGGGAGVAQSGGEFPQGSVPPPRISELGAAARAAGCTVKDLPSEGADHVPGPVSYRSKPPHSGNHDQIPAEDQAYLESARRENLVHSLEHGRVVLWFSPTLPPQTKGDLKALFDEDPYHVILAPNDDMPFKVAASAWTHVLGCERMSSAAVDAIRAFRTRYRDRGPEFVP